MVSETRASIKRPSEDRKDVWKFQFKNLNLRVVARKPESEPRDKAFFHLIHSLPSDEKRERVGILTVTLRVPTSE